MINYEIRTGIGRVDFQTKCEIIHSISEQQITTAQQQRLYNLRGEQKTVIVMMILKRLQEHVYITQKNVIKTTQDHK